MMPDDNGPKLASGEKIFVGSFAVACFAMSAGFVVASEFWGVGFPAVFVAVALSICIACIVYAFLGGVAGAEFSLGEGLKLAGSAAVIAAVYYVISDPLDKSMNDAAAITAGKAAERTIADEHAARGKAERQVLELQSEVGIRQSGGDAAVLARVRQSTADDNLGRGLISIFRNHQGPFRRRTVEFEARFVQDVPGGTFSFCHDRNPELQDKQVQFEMVDPETGASKNIQLRAGGDIGPGACQVIKFDIQLGCDATAKLLALACDDRRGVAWPATADNRPYKVFATTQNPDFD
jgi:hypothetical protein